MASPVGGGSSQAKRVSDKGKGPVRLATTPTAMSTPPGSASTPSRSAVGHAHALLGLAAPSLQDFNHEPAPPVKKARKERGPNWSNQEVLALVQAKRALQDEEDNCVDKRSLMYPDANRWLRISRDVMQSGVPTTRRDGPCCKSKWNLVIPEFKRISDYFARSGTNYMDYWHMTNEEKKAEGLPKVFPQEVFLNLREWLGIRPTIQPPHGRDLLSKADSVYKSVGDATEEMNDDDDTFDTGDNDIGTAAFNDFSGDRSKATSSAIRHRSMSQSKSGPTLSMSSPSQPTPCTQKAVIPLGVTPIVISSSHNESTPGTGRTGSTGVRRKSLSGPAIIADATRTSGLAMTEQLKNIAQAGREVELSKIELQMKLFTDQMVYQRDRDQQLFENAKLANENAKLAIIKQGQVVSCLAHLSHVLQAGLNVKSNTPVHCVRREGPVAAEVLHVNPAPSVQNPSPADAGAAQTVPPQQPLGAPSLLPEKPGDA